MNVVGCRPGGGCGYGFLIDGRPVPPPKQIQTHIIEWLARDTSARWASSLRADSYSRRATNKGHLESSSSTSGQRRYSRQDPVGRRIQFPALAEKPSRWFTIVGVVKDIKNIGLQVEAHVELYVPYKQYPSISSPRVLVVRTADNPARSLHAIRERVALLDKGLPVADVMTLEEILTRSRAHHRFLMVLLVVFAALALTLAAVGIYGVLAYSVAHRTHEIGISHRTGRRASRDVLRLILAQGLKFALAGACRWPRRGAGRNARARHPALWCYTNRFSDFLRCQRFANHRWPARLLPPCAPGDEGRPHRGAAL